MSVRVRVCAVKTWMNVAFTRAAVLRSVTTPRAHSAAAVAKDSSSNTIDKHATVSVI